jgi:16S rRNA C967 or C1407 C5-methylase (RsmB/RsmF family)/NOL1/NOP2/fmu family ribosome biogenesis protein
MITLPDAFIENILSLYSAEAGYFFEALQQAPNTSIRLNRSKFSSAFENETTVWWCKEGRILKQRPSFTEDPLWHAGAYYVQESSSMFLSAIIHSISQEFSAPVVLDLCAAPGGKTSTLLDSLPDSSLVIANEIIKARVPVLQENLIKWGKPNVIVTHNDPKHFQKLETFFDIILVDAPCSGEGLWRRDAKAMEEWSMDHVRLCETRQARILHECIDSLKPGGYLIYSTCTFNQFENENQVTMLRERYGFEPKLIEIPEAWPISTSDAFQFKFLPHKVSGEGLFMAVLQKPNLSNHAHKLSKHAKLNFLPKKFLPAITKYLDQPDLFDYFIENEFVFAFPKAMIDVYEQLREVLYLKSAGICMGKFDKNGNLIPEHALALSVHISKTIVRVNLTAEDARIYLKKGTLIPKENWPQAWCLACYNDLPLGWMKVLANRVNNYFPSEYRILKDLS